MVRQSDWQILDFKRSDFVYFHFELVEVFNKGPVSENDCVAEGYESYGGCLCGNQKAASC